MMYNDMEKLSAKLLLREQRAPLVAAASAAYCGKRVLITGGGGSIGSEIARKIAKCAPQELVILDSYENNAYEIEQELKREFGASLHISVEIGSVQDKTRVRQVFSAHRPEVVFHAAAHKHVPLMEHSPAEAVKNNIFGTVITADAAETVGTEKFVLISTDKAVNPTNVMGATKRICEMILCSRRDGATDYSAVRFGNVFGSNGSVIPLFRRQIAEGGPVTVTDRRMTRYFMTVSEAANLVLDAGAIAHRGELFVLDMGEPVRMYDIAERMIRLEGLEPGRDIEIREIGLRPGEKLYEELLVCRERMTATENNLIFVEHEEPISKEASAEILAILRRAVDADAAGKKDAVRCALHRILPNFSR